MAFSAPIAVFKAAPVTPPGVILDDGDIVVLIPDTTSSIWTGDVLRGSNGPAGIGGIAPASSPLPGAPMFALLADAGGPTVLGGGAPFTTVVNRTSLFKSGGALRLFYQ